MRKLPNLVGEKVNKLTVKEWSNERKSWKCDCECGGIAYAQTYVVKNKLIKYCKECVHKTHYQGDISRAVYIQLKWGAKKRKYEFSITHEYMWELFVKQNKKCALTNIDLIFGKTQKEECSGVPTASLDRIDNTKGYIVGNVQWVHKVINKMKQTLTQEEFIQWCKLVANNFRD